MDLYRKTLTVACPVCGGFWQGLDALWYVAVLGAHPQAVAFGFDADYRLWVDEVIEQAEGVVA